MSKGAAGQATVDHLPLIGRPSGDILFRRAGGEVVTCEQFLLHVAATAACLPERRYALNLCSDRYHFLVAFAAAVVRGQINLLSSDRSPRWLEQLAASYPEAYTIGDGGDPIPGVEHAPLVLASTGTVRSTFRMPATQLAALVLTSGSTGAPMVHRKPWGTLVPAPKLLRSGSGFVGPTVSVHRGHRAAATHVRLRDHRAAAAACAAPRAMPARPSSPTTSPRRWRGAGSPGAGDDAAADPHTARRRPGACRRSSR